MSTTSLPRVPVGSDLERTQIIINQFLDEFDWLFGGFVDSKNVREIGGWLVSLDRLQSKDKDVGMSTADDGADPIRFWAGDAKNAAPNFTVTRNGILTAVGALIKSSANDYPRVELSSTNKLLAAYLDATHYVAINPNVGSTPGLAFYDNDILQALITYITGGGALFATYEGDITLQPARNLSLRPGNKVTVENWSAFLSTSNSKTLQQELDAMKASIPAGSYAVVTYDGNGVPTSGRSLAASDIPNLDWSKITSGKPSTLSGYGINDGWGNNTSNSRSAIRAHQTVAQTLAINIWTKITFDAEDYDQLNEYASSRFTAQSAGIYDVSAAVSYTSLSAGQRALLFLYKNGSTHSKLGDIIPGGNSDSATIGSTHIKLAAGDYIEIYGYLTVSKSTTPSASDTFITITRIA